MVLINKQPKLKLVLILVSSLNRQYVSSFDEVVHLYLPLEFLDSSDQ